MYKFIGHKTMLENFYVILCMYMFSTNLGSQRTRFADVLLCVETGVLIYYLAGSQHQQDLRRYILISTHVSIYHKNKTTPRLVLFRSLSLAFKQNVINFQKQTRSSFCVPNRCESIISIKNSYTLIGKSSDKLYETIPQTMLYFYNVLQSIKYKKCTCRLIV